MYVTAKMWVQDPDDEDVPLTVLPVHITAELNDSDQIFLDLNLPDDVVFQLELGEHNAALMALEMMEMVNASHDERKRDINAVIERLNKTTEEE